MGDRGGSSRSVLKCIGLETHSCGIPTDRLTSLRNSGIKPAVSTTTLEIASEKPPSRLPGLRCLLVAAIGVDDKTLPQA
jgi:hypothetical protein